MKTSLLAQQFLRDMDVFKPLRVFGRRSGNLEKGVPLYGTGGQVVSCEELEQSLSGILGKIVPYEAARLARYILRVFLDAEVAGISIGSDWQDLCDFFTFCASAGMYPKETLENTVISVGYGGSEQEPCLRFPAYAIPALEILRGLRVLNCPLPRVRIFSAQMAAVKVNGLDPEKVWPATMHQFALLKLFIQEFYGEVAEQVFFDFDRPVDTFQNTAGTLQDFLVKSAPGSPQLTEMFAVMNAQANRRCGSNGHAGLYPALHALLFGDVFPKHNRISAWASSVAHDRCTLISLGGWPERYFNAARVAVAREASSLLGEDAFAPRHSIRLLVNVGKKPVYYPEPGEPIISVGAVERLWDKPRGWEGLEGRDANNTRDYEIIRHQVGVEDFLSWVQGVSRLYFTVRHFGRGQEVLTQDKQVVSEVVLGSNREGLIAEGAQAGTPITWPDAIPRAVYYQL